MYSNSDHRVPIVTNSRYAGHGFTEEGNTTELQTDETLQTRPIFQYDEPNNNTYPYSDVPGELDRLLTPSDGSNLLYYQNEQSGNITRLSQVYRKRLGLSSQYPNTNTYHVDSTEIGPIPKESLTNNTLLESMSNFFKSASVRGADCLSSVISITKSFFVNALGIALGVFLTMFFFALFSHFFFNNSNLPNFKNEPKKKQTPPPVDKPEIKKEVPPPKPEMTFEPVYFKDILGIDEAKDDVLEVVKFIKQPYLYKKVGAKIPKGILLVGAPGTGKTMLAKAVATETGIPFIYTSGPEFVEIYVGQGAQRIRALFQKARKIAPCIIFIDEIDAVGSKRASGSFSGQNREHDQTLNQLLVEMDGFNVSTGITILAATNRMSTLDKALLRPGRFDRVVHIPLPSIKGREEILNHYLKEVKYDKEGVKVKELAKITPGYSGADLKNLINEAALITVKQDRQLVELKDLYEARDKIIMGNKRNLLMPELERKMTAYHEAGHALVAYYLYPNTDPIHKATIITRGTALGFVEQLPNDEYDKSSYKRIEMKSRLAVCMAGRLAEKLVFGFENVTSGASSDIVVATDLAYKMITQYGMSNNLASLNFHNLNNLNNKLSSELNVKIEKEIIKLIKDAEHLAESILRTNRKQLELLAKELLKHETLTGDQIKTLLKTNKSLNLAEEAVSNQTNKTNDLEHTILTSPENTNQENKTQDNQPENTSRTQETNIDSSGNDPSAPADDNVGGPSVPPDDRKEDK